MKRFFKVIFGLIFIVYLIVVTKAFFTDPVKETRFSPRNKVDVIAHQGGAGIHPSNTLYAMQKAAALGVDILEMDVHRSADGHLVLIHDHTVDRMTNGTGKVMEKTAAELISLDAAYYFSPDPDYSNIREKKRRHQLKNQDSKYPLRGKGIRIPLLKEVFEAFPDKRMIIEIKQKSPSIAEQFCRLIRSYHRQQDILVGSFHQQAKHQFREHCPDVPTSATPREAVLFFVGSKLKLTRAFSSKAVALHLPGAIKLPESLSFLGSIESISPGLVKEAHRKNMTIHVWTVNEPQEMKKLIDLQVDGIMTDYPQKMTGLMKQIADEK